MLHCHLPHHMMNQMVSMVGPISKESPHAMHTQNFYPADDPAKKKVPGYPQDMWMTMDGLYQKPETYGLPQGWTGAMMGMMTLIRVLPPDLFDKIQELKRHA
jgi:hypothetical protein